MCRICPFFTFASKKCVFVNVKCFKLKYKGILTSTQAIFETKMCANLKGVGAPFCTDLRYLLRHYLATLDTPRQPFLAVSRLTLIFVSLLVTRQSCWRHKQMLQSVLYQETTKML